MATLNIVYRIRPTDAELIKRMRAIRKRTRSVYRKMSKYAPVPGFVPREHDDPDPTMDLIERALAVAPRRTRELLLNGIASNDKTIVELTQELARG